MTQPKFTTFKELFCYRENSSPNQILFKIYQENEIKEITILEFLSVLKERIDHYQSDSSFCKAIIGSTSLDTITSFFASVMAGKQTILIDSTYTLSDLIRIFQLADVDSIETEDDLFDQEEMLTLTSNLCNPISAADSNQEGDILFFTSGTTSLSKAVILDSRILLSSAFHGQCMLPCTQNDTILSVLPLNHVFGFVCSLLWPLAYDGTVAIGRGMRHLTDDPALFSPTILPLVPTAAEFLILSNAMNHNLQTLLIGGGPLTDSLIHAIKRQNIRLCFGYGLTETASGVALSIGSDPHNMTPCPECQIELIDDEIVISSTCLMKGYYHNPEATSQVMDAHKFYSKDTGYLTSSGDLVVTGRKDDILVLSNGTKINCAEYEHNLEKLLPQYDFAVCLKGQRLTLVYYCNSHPNGECQKEILTKLDFFNQTLPLGQKITNCISLSRPIDRTITGKIKRYLL